MIIARTETSGGHERKGKEPNRAHLMISFSELTPINDKGQSQEEFSKASAFEPDRKDAPADNTPTRLNLSVAELLRNVKSDEYALLRDTPDGFLNAEQIQGKAKGQEQRHQTAILHYNHADFRCTLDWWRACLGGLDILKCRVYYTFVL